MTACRHFRSRPPVWHLLGSNCSPLSQGRHRYPRHLLCGSFGYAFFESTWIHLRFIITSVDIFLGLLPQVPLEKSVRSLVGGQVIEYETRPDPQETFSDNHHQTVTIEATAYIRGIAAWVLVVCPSFAKNCGRLSLCDPGQMKAKLLESLQLLDPVPVCGSRRRRL